MSKKLYDETSIQDIANAIREKNETTNTYKVTEMANAIRDIEAGQVVIPFRESDTENPIRICAHRGFCAYTHENSAIAVLSALNTGFYYIECDIQMSLDGEYYVAHDGNFKDMNGTSYSFNKVSSAFIDEVDVCPPADKETYNKINLPLKFERLSKVIESAELIERDFELWLEIKNFSGLDNLNTFISYLNQNVSSNLKSKIRLFGSGVNDLLASQKLWDKTLYYTASSIGNIDFYEKCVEAKNLGIDIIAYPSISRTNFELANIYYEEHGIETAIYTLKSTSMFGALSKYQGIKYICADNVANWNWQDYFVYKEESEFSTQETWDFSIDATGSEGTSFTTNGTVVYDDGATLGTTDTYMYLNLPYDSKLNGIAEFELEWIPNSTQQRMFHIGAYNNSDGLVGDKANRLGFYSSSDALWAFSSYDDIASETRTMKIKVYWNAYSYMVYVDEKPVGSHTIPFNSNTNQTGRNFYFGSNSTAFTGTIRNLIMWY